MEKKIKKKKESGKEETKKITKYNRFRKNKKETEKVMDQNKKIPTKYNRFRKNKKENDKVLLKNESVNKKETEKVFVKNEPTNKKKNDKVLLKNEHTSKKETDNVFVKNEPTNKKKNDKVLLKNEPTNKKDAEKVFVKSEHTSKKEGEKEVLQNESNSNNNINGWAIYNVDGDGSCAFHSIMLYYEKTNKKNSLDEKYGNSGHSLRDKVTEIVKKDITVYNTLNNTNKKYINNIYKHPLVNIDKNTIIKHMKDSLKILVNHKIYTTNDELQIISAILGKKIFVWNQTEKKWYNISIPNKFNYEIKDSIFLYFNINHYQLLLPNKNYIFKSSYNDLPDDYIFNYNFLEKKKNN
jgi:CCR4-NOT transcription complex subunit 2